MVYGAMLFTTFGRRGYWIKFGQKPAQRIKQISRPAGPGIGNPAPEAVTTTPEQITFAFCFCALIYPHADKSPD